MGRFELTVLILKALGSGFSFTVCLAALVYLVYYKLYIKLLHRLFILLLVSSCLYSFSVLFESFAVNLPVLVTENSIKEVKAACTVSGALIHYSTWVDILVITMTAVWLARITVKTKRFSKAIDKETYKKRIRQKYWEGIGYALLFLVPILFIIPPIAAGRYEVSEGTWCRIQLEMNTTDSEIELDATGITMALLLWYIPVFILMVIVTVILILANIKLLKKLKGSSAVLKDSYSNVLKDGISLSIFLIIIYVFYGVNIFASLYYITKSENDIPLWIIEAIVTAVRGVAVLFMFFNQRMRRQVLKNKVEVEERLLNVVFHKNNQAAYTESLLQTPSIIPSEENTEEPFEIQVKQEYGKSADWKLEANKLLKDDNQINTI